MADIPQYDDDTLMQLQAAGQLSPGTIQAIKAQRAPASVPAPDGDDPALVSGRKFGMSPAMLDDKTGIRQFDVPQGQKDVEPTKGFAANLPDWLTKPGSQMLSESAKYAPETTLDQTKAMLADPNSAYAKSYPDKLQQAAKYYGLSNGGPSPASVGTATPETAGGAPSKVDVSQLAGQGTPASSGSLPPMANPDYYNTMLGGFSKQAKGYDALADAQSDAAEKTADIYDKAAGELKSYDDQIKGSYQDLQAKTQAQLADISALGKKIETAQQLDPNRYWHNMSTGGKIASIVGIALGGFGMGYAGKQGNPVMDQINHYIDQDIQAQKDNYERLRGQLGDKQTLYGLARQQGLDDVSALQAARAAALGRVSMEAHAQAARSQSPEIMARNQVLQGELDQHLGAAKMDMAQRTFMMKAYQEAASGGGIANPSFLPEDMQKKTVKMPNGLYRIANSEKGAEAVANISEKGDEVKNVLGKLMQLQQTAGRSLPGSQAKALADQYLSELYFANQKLDDMSRLSDVDLGLLKEQFADPTSMMQDRASAVLKSKYQMVDDKQERVRQQYIPGYKPSKKAYK